MSLVGEVFVFLVCMKKAGGRTEVLGVVLVFSSLAKQQAYREHNF
jgi:hypothetical protein